MLKSKIEKALNKQIELGASSSQYYLAMASWTESQGLTGTAEILYHHSDEEREHMLKLVKFINERGGTSVITGLSNPHTTFNSLASVFESLLEHELNVTDSIITLLFCVYLKRIIQLIISCNGMFQSSWKRKLLQEQF